MIVTLANQSYGDAFMSPLIGWCNHHIINGSHTENASFVRILISVCVCVCVCVCIHWRKWLNLLHSSSHTHHVHSSSCRSALTSSLSGRGLRCEGSGDRPLLTQTRSAHPYLPTEHFLLYFCLFYTHFVSIRHFLFRRVCLLFTVLLHVMNCKNYSYCLFLQNYLLIVCGVLSVFVDAFDCLFCDCLCNCVCLTVCMYNMHVIMNVRMVSHSCDFGCDSLCCDY